jgi:hypothetical protein
MAVCGCLAGQTAPGDFAALQRTLGLSDIQLAKLLEPKAAPVRTPGTGDIVWSSRPGAASISAAPSGDPVQIALLDDRQRSQLAELRKVLGRYDAAALATGLGLIDRKLWPGDLCDFYPIGAYSFADELALTESQRQALTRLKRAAQAAGARPPHEQALAILNEAQRTQIEAFERDLRVAGEAIALRLIAAPGGEILCH